MSESMETCKQVAQLKSSETKRKRAEEEINHRLELEKTISTVSCRFVGVADIDCAISNSLCDIGMLCGASRAYVFLTSEAGTTVDNTHEWCAENVSPQVDNLKGLSIDAFPCWLAELRKGKTIHVKDVSEMPADARNERDLLESQDISSCLVLPLYVGEQLGGLVGFDNVTSAGEWTDDDLAILRIFAQIVGSALERKRMEGERRNLEQRAQLASHLAAVGEMASGIAHEINNPLTSVIGYSQLLLLKDIPEDIKGDIENIYGGAQRVANTVKRLLTFARQHKPEREHININDIIIATLDLRAYHLETSNIEIITRLDPGLPVTFADAGQFQQVFLNLIINAEMEMKSAHGRGKLSVETRNVDSTIQISFTDDGPGIAEENLGKIFDPFFTTKEVDKGTGLGLSICHGIIAEHNGRIYAENNPGNGATFIIELPVAIELQINGATEGGC